MRTLFSVILVLGPTIYFGASGKPKEMGIAVVAGAIAASFVNLSKIKFFKGAGFEAEVLHEAESTILAVRKIARPLLLATIDTITMAGRFGGMRAEKKHAFLADLTQTAEDLGISEQREMIEAVDRFFRYHCWDHFGAFAHSISVDPDWSKDVKERLNTLRTFDSIDFPSKVRIFEILQTCDHRLTSEQEDFLQDYLFYVETRKLRNPRALRG